MPGTWFLSGTAAGTLGIVAIQVFSFAIHWWMGVASVIMTFFLALVACRATGETDITPIGAMGKITQLFYGVIAPANITTNLMTACVTAGAAASAADLLTDLKSGYLLGANPRKQFIAQFLGIFAGALVIVPAFYLIVPTAGALGGDEFPAPAAQVWKGVAELLAHGLSSLGPTERWSLVIGGLAGVLIPALDRFASSAGTSFPAIGHGVGPGFRHPFLEYPLHVCGGSRRVGLRAALQRSRRPVYHPRRVRTDCRGEPRGRSHCPAERAGVGWVLGP